MPEIQVKDKLITLEELGTAYNNTVKKSGDIMTGGLTIKSTSLDNSVNPSSDQYIDSLAIQDKNSKRMGLIRHWRNADGSNGLQFSAVHEGSSAKFNMLKLTVNSTGDTTYEVSDPANFRSAIGALAVGEEIPLLSSSLAINNTSSGSGLQYVADYDYQFNKYKFVDLYFIVQGGYINAIRLCPEYGDKTYKFGFFAWNTSDSVVRKVAVAFSTSGRYLTDCVVRMAYGDNGTFDMNDNVLYLYKAIGYKW